MLGRLDGVLTGPDPVDETVFCYSRSGHITAQANKQTNKQTVYHFTRANK